MRYFVTFFSVLLLLSCNSSTTQPSRKSVTVSIPPYGWFVNEIGGDEFTVNIMVPATADHHVYEPAPQQVTELSRSAGYMSNGLLSFEITWLDRFYETNRSMAKLDLSDGIELIEAADHHHHEGEHSEHEEGADPHYWLSVSNALIIAEKTLGFLISLEPSAEEKLRTNYQSVVNKITETGRYADSLLKGYEGGAFMIFHPALGYIARDYNLEQIAVEKEGKEPSASDMKELVDKSHDRKIKYIFVQSGYDTKNAAAIAEETGATVLEIDPLGNDWVQFMKDIVFKMHTSLKASAEK